MRQVDLHDVDEPLLDERTDVLHRVRALAGRDRQARRRADPRQRFRVLRRYRLLDPFGRVRLERAATRTAVAGVKRPCISIMICTSGPTASRTAATMSTARRRSAAGSSALRRAERIELERAIPAIDDALARAGAIAAGSRSAWYHPFAYAGTRSRKRPPSSFHTGTPSAWPYEIPAGDVERRQRRLRHLARPAVLGSLDVPRQPLDVERIGADDIARRQFVHARDQRVRAVDHAHFADANEPLVGASSTNTSSRQGVPTTVVQTSEIVSECKLDTSFGDHR